MGNLELFLDLVFVYAMAQTELVQADVSWRGFGHGALALLAVWWAWVCYAWLTNTFTTNRVASRCSVVAAMALMLLAASVARGTSVVNPRAELRDSVSGVCHDARRRSNARHQHTA